MQLRPLPFAAGPVFALVFWSAFAIWTLPEAVAWKAKRSADSAKARDQGSLSLIATLGWIGIAFDFLLSLFLPQAAISWQRTSLFVAGICLMLLGVALRWYSVSVLGKYFTFDVAIQSGQVLVEVGPYRGSVWRWAIGRALPPVSAAWGLPTPTAYLLRKLRSPPLSARPTRNI